jgi:hypothetical protein
MDLSYLVEGWNNLAPTDAPSYRVCWDETFAHDGLENFSKNALKRKSSEKRNVCC